MSLIIPQPFLILNNICLALKRLMTPLLINGLINNRFSCSRIYAICNPRYPRHELLIFGQVRHITRDNLLRQ